MCLLLPYPSPEEDEDLDASGCAFIGLPLETAERPVSSQQSPAELITEASDRALRIGIGHSRPSGLYFSARQLQPREERRPKPNIQY